MRRLPLPRKRARGEHGEPIIPMKSELSSPGGFGNVKLSFDNADDDKPKPEKPPAKA